MKRIAITICLLTVTFAFTFGQPSTDSISIKKVFGGYQFYQGEKRLNMNQLVNAMKPNEQAFSQIKSAQSTYTLATIVGIAGGFMVGWPIGTAIGGGEPNWTMAGIGAGLIVVSIPISQKFNKQAKQAVGTFNSGLQTSSFWNKSELRYSMTGNGVGLSSRFYKLLPTTRGIKNCQVCRLFKGYSPPQPLNNLTGNGPQSATFHTANRYKPL